MNTRTILLSVAWLLLAPLPSAAQSVRAVTPAELPTAARDFARSQLDLCKGAGGRLSFSNRLYAVATDFNGDGEPDILLDSGALQCAGVHNPYCGGDGRSCQVTLFASSPGGHKNAGTIRGDAELVSVAGRPAVRMTQGGRTQLYGWRNGLIGPLTGAASGASPPAASLAASSAVTSAPVPAVKPGAPSRAAAPVAGGVRIEVKLDPRAASIMAQAGKPIAGHIYYYGEPLPAYRDDADELGRYNLQNQSFAVPAQGGIVMVQPTAIAAGELRKVRAPMLAVGMETRAARVLCSDADLSLAAARSGGVVLTCQGR